MTLRRWRLVKRGVIGGAINKRPPPSVKQFGVDVDGNRVGEWEIGEMSGWTVTRYPPKGRRL